MTNIETIRLYGEGLSIRDVAKRIGSNRETVRRALVDAGAIRERLSYIAPIEERVAGWIEPDLNSGCWLWSGRTNNMGYGQISWDGRSVLAHRATFAMEKGFMPPSTSDLCHRCDTPSCVNPAHLFVGTRSDNMQDASRKGRLKKRRHG